MSRIKSFEDLEVWQAGKALTLKIYELTQQFPREEVFGMASQMRRASLSVPANIAEGFGRYHFMDKAKFYLNARGSLFELKSHVLIAAELKLIKDGNGEDILLSIDELSKSINNLIRSTRSFKKGDSGN